MSYVVKLVSKLIKVILVILDNPRYSLILLGKNTTIISIILILRNMNIFKLITLNTLFIFCSSIAFSQYSLSLEASKMEVAGTSSLHDWTEDVTEMSSTLNAEVADGKILKVTGIKATIPVKGLKSGKGGMDDNTYKALKQKEHPNMTYSIKSFGIDGDEIHLTGNLTIAGTTKSVKFHAKYKVEGEKITFEGKHAFKMTDFNIDPPTAMMGTIKTGDDITITFNLVYNK